MGDVQPRPAGPGTPLRVAALALAGLLVACSQGAPAAQPSASASPSPRATTAATPTPEPTQGPPAPAVSFKPPEVVASGLTAPWSIAFADDGTAWFTERTGSVRVIRGGQLQADPALTLNVSQAPGSESGLLGIALKLPRVYLYYTYAGATGKVNRISEFTAEGVQLHGERVLVDGIPGGACCHFGGRLAFGPDGALYASVGDGQVPARAASSSGLNGRVLRIDVAGAAQSTYAFGLRNPQGLAWAPDGSLWATDNGPTGEFGIPTGYDEVDHLQQGGNYGWPAYAGDRATGAAGAPNPIPPVAQSGGSATWAPSGATFYSPDPKRQAPTLYWATLTGKAILRLYNDQVQTVLTGYGRLRDVERNPADNCLYVLTSNRDGRGSPAATDDRVLKLCPA